MKKLLAICGMTLALGVSANSPYLTKVYEFKPAPGQFINTMPEYEEGDDDAKIIVKVEEQICGDKNPGMITLGAWGGYVVFGFDHPVVNVKGEYDFKIYGNAFLSNGNTNKGSCEPGIVMVSHDDNSNGVPDDKWYELAGSEYGKETTLHGYKLTYYYPASDHVAVPDPNYRYITDRQYIKWEDNKGNTGYVMKNSFHAQDYWPLWIGGETLVFEGCRLADNYAEESGSGTNYTQAMLGYGYADNQPNMSDPGFKIDWAVDDNGVPVELPSIHFIKVYNAMNQYCGWIGESSTEICGAEDLHPNAELSGVDLIVDDENTQVEYYNLQGVKVENPQNGIFIKRQAGKTTKVIL